MAQSSVQPSQHPAIQGYFDWLNGAKSPGEISSTASSAGIPSNFVPTPKVAEFFKNAPRYRDILKALWPYGPIPFSPDVVIQEYAKVFCILLAIQKGHFIANFVQDDDLSDSKLPFSTRPATFPRGSMDDDLFDAFSRTQWLFCAPELKFRKEVKFGPNHILPIIHKQPLGKGGSAQTFQIILHSAYNRLTDPTAGTERAPSQRHANTFALKTYRTRDAADYYRKEAQAYKLVTATHPAGLLEFYGGFEHDGSYSLILEYADNGTLEEYFRKQPPPETARDIFDFWCSMFGIASALISIHRTELDQEDGSAVLNGWHQDVKPENILVLSGGRSNPYAFQFKLSDLGLSHFKESKGKEAADADSYGTRTYGAPECFRLDGAIGSLDLPVKQSVDIWSLGCVWSESAVWVISGYTGLDHYRERRGEATTGGFTDHGCFHDGRKVLDVVSSEHWERVNNKRRGDCITKPVLDIVADMLAEHPDGRPSAKLVYHQTTRIRRDNEEMVKRRTSKIISKSSMSSQASSSISDSTPSASEPARSPPQSIDSLTSSFPRSPPQSLASRSVEALAKRNSTGPRRTQSRPDSMPLSVLIERPMGSTDHQDHFCDTPRSMTANDGHFHSLTAISETNIPQSHPPRGPDLPHRPVTEYAARPSVETVPGRNSGHSRTGRSGRPPPPKLDVSTAIMWKTKKKSSSKFSSIVRPRGPRNHSALPDNHLLSSLSTRDHVFLIDDAISMLPHWKDVKTLFGVLAYIVKKSDPDGVEMHFTIRQDHFRSKKTTDLSAELERVHPTGVSDMRMSMNTILNKYAQDIREHNYGQSEWDKRPPLEPLRPLNLYIFTDGKWQPDCDVERAIRSFVRTLESLNVSPGMVGIQFIRFGDDAASKELLEHLDSGLNLGMDIVDTEPYNGNVWKMLLGAINPWFDDDNDDDDENHSVTLKRFSAKGLEG